MTFTTAKRRPNGLDLIALGEVMLRFDPGEGRVRTTRSFDVHEGGGEYNVARGLRRTFELRTAIITALADNDVGRLVEDLMLQGGVDLSYLQWTPYDGIGHTARNGLNFTERGFGVRGAVGTSDRGHTAAAALAPGDVDWDHIFGERGVRWLHTGGIFAGLSPSTSEVVLEAVQAAQRHSVTVSYDINYRPSLWKSNGGLEAAERLNRSIVPFVDVLFGTGPLGLAVKTGRDRTSRETLSAQMSAAKAQFPNLKVIATTRRQVRSATINDWGAVAWSEETGEVEATDRPGLEILDRIGGGDSFASGLIFGLLDGRSLSESLELGAAHGALAMTTPGDSSMATQSEVEALAIGGTAETQR